MKLYLKRRRLYVLKTDCYYCEAENAVFYMYAWKAEEVPLWEEEGGGLPEERTC
jgi:hypothetical protein